MSNFKKKNSTTTKGDESRVSTTKASSLRTARDLVGEGAFRRNRLLFDPEAQACIDGYHRLKGTSSINNAYGAFLCEWLQLACPPSKTGSSPLSVLTDSPYREFDASKDLGHRFETLKTEFEHACLLAGGTFCVEDYTVSGIPKPFLNNPDAPRFSVQTTFKEVPVCKPRNLCLTQELVPLAVKDIHGQMHDWSHSEVDDFVRCHEYTPLQLDQKLRQIDSMRKQAGNDEIYFQPTIIKRPAMGFDPNRLEHHRFTELREGDVSIESIRSNGHVMRLGSNKDGTAMSYGSGYSGGQGQGVKMAFVGSGITALIAMMGLGYVVVTKRHQRGALPPSKRHKGHKNSGQRGTRKIGNNGKKGQPIDRHSSAHTQDLSDHGDEDTWADDNGDESEEEDESNDSNRNRCDSEDTFKTPTKRFMIERLQSYQIKMNNIVTGTGASNNNYRGTTRRGIDDQQAWQQGEEEEEAQINKRVSKTGYVGGFSNKLPPSSRGHRNPTPSPSNDSIREPKNNQPNRIHDVGHRTDGGVEVQLPNSTGRIFRSNNREPSSKPSSTRRASGRRSSSNLITPPPPSVPRQETQEDFFGDPSQFAWPCSGDREQIMQSNEDEYDDDYYDDDDGEDSEDYEDEDEDSQEEDEFDALVFSSVNRYRGASDRVDL